VTSAAGAGSAFWVNLKSAPASRFPSGKSAHQAVHQLPLGPSNAPPRTILYVEDNPGNLKLVQEMMMYRPDLCLLTATDGHQGVRLARQHQPEVILMDINLPDIDGIEALKLLRNDALTKDIPVIALTANAMPRDVADSVAAGFFRYLTKPIDIDQFFNVTDSALAARGSVRSNN
jgi:CheY-like chemotaxis protein